MSDPIRVLCPACGKKGKVPAAFRGQRIKCSRCGQSFRASSKSTDKAAANVLLKPREANYPPLDDPDDMYI